MYGWNCQSQSFARELLHVIDEPPPATLDLLGVAHRAVAPALPDHVDTSTAVAALRRWGWLTCAESVGAEPDRADDAVAALAVALTALEEAGFELAAGAFDAYAEAMMSVARAEIAGVPTGSPAAAVRYVVLGTVLAEPILLALRRLAQREASAARFPPPRPAG